MTDDISLKNGRYIFKDKREKDPWEDKILNGELITMRKQASIRKSIVAKEAWRTMSARDKYDHAQKTKIGQQRSLMIRMVKEKTPYGTCVGCKQDTDNINREILPRIVWICTSCLHLYKKHR